MNAIVERSDDLCKVGVLRLCGPSGHSIPPFSNFDEEMKKCMMGHVALLSGGYEYDVQEISVIKEDEIIQETLAMKEKGITQIVICGVFSPLSSEQEEAAAAIIRRVYPDADVTLSSKVANMGLLERENAAIINSSLKPLARKTIAAFRKALHFLGLKCPFYLTQNDGTLLTSAAATELPVRTIGSGSTNSIRGAAFLAGIKNALVVDIGGTTTDVGHLVNGFPRLSSSAVYIAGIRTNFMIPDTFSCGLGGGSDEIQIGPQSVSYDLVHQSKCFGGTVVTATDIAVAAGIASNIGDASLVSDIPQTVVERGLKQIRETVEESIEHIKTRKDDVPVILVGGGSVLIDESHLLAGTSATIKPSHFQIANAVGAAIAQVSGSIDVMVHIGEETRDAALTRLKQQAIDLTVSNGGKRETVEIVELEQIDIAYSMGRALRFVIKAAGDLDHDREMDTVQNPSDLVIEDEQDEDTDTYSRPAKPVTKHVVSASSTRDLTNYIPNVKDKVWYISDIDVECIAIGAGIIGSGGGGNTYYSTIATKRALKSGQQIRIMDLESMPEDGYLYSLGQMGAPSVCDVSTVILLHEYLN
jgi:N-methylhydantoinase A/oxoprolinase/acetone carboxylase beta subunit